MFRYYRTKLEYVSALRAMMDLAVIVGDDKKFLAILNILYFISCFKYRKDCWLCSP